MNQIYLGFVWGPGFVWGVWGPRGGLRGVWGPRGGLRGVIPVVAISIVVFDIAYRFGFETI